LKLLVLGATGKTGREIVTQGLARGATITALVRSPGKLQVRDARLEIVTGNPLDKKSLEDVAGGKDAVLSVIGHTDLTASSLVTEGAEALTQAMYGRVRRLVIISSTLVGPGGSFLTRIPRLLTRHALRDSSQMESVVEQQAGLDWTILRLVRLTSKGVSPYHLFDNEPPSVSPSVSRATVASCMLDLVANATHVKKTVGIRAAQPHDSEGDPRGVSSSRQ
jgi:putative NADH-flavin reductase